MKNKAVQIFTDEYLENCKKLTPLQIVTFLDNFRQLNSPLPSPKKSKLISLKVPEELLEAFRKKAELQDTPYQSQIKILMREWLND